MFTPQKYLIKTLGCQANLADSNTMAGILESLGLEEVKIIEDPVNESTALLKTLPEVDLFIINTCSVRQKSEDKAYGVGKIFKKLKDNGIKTPHVVMAGCMVGSATGQRQRFEFEQLKKKTPWVDTYINPTQLFDLPNVLNEKKVLSEWAVKKFDPNGIYNKQVEKKRAFVNISNGCDNFCTFCVVPYARGKEVSRSSEEIIKEISHLTMRGITEVTLCGQNVNSWGLTVSEKFKLRTGSNQKLPFAKLLREIHEIPEITKIDFISSNPFDFTNDLIEAIKLPKISNYMHIAVQSGNNEVLKNMNRRHTIEEFTDLIEKIKLAKPGVEIGTDLIVGFPGETDAQFRDTVELVKRIKFNVAFIAMYSPRKGTFADKELKDDVTRDEKKSRHDILTKAWKESLK